MWKLSKTSIITSFFTFEGGVLSSSSRSEVLIWWEEVDSNYCNSEEWQIYSLLPLTSQPSSQKDCSFMSRFRANNLKEMNNPFKLVERIGFEPMTNGLKVRCSTDWANIPWR